MKISQIRKYGKTATLLIAAVFMQMNQASAQFERGGDRQGRASVPDSIDVTMIVKRLSEKLSLSDAQQIEISKLSQEHFADARAMKKEEKIARLQKREAIQKERDEFEAKLKATMTDAQIEKYEEILQSRKARGKGRKGRDRSGAGKRDRG